MKNTRLSQKYNIQTHFEHKTRDQKVKGLNATDKVWDFLFFSSTVQQLFIVYMQ